MKIKKIFLLLLLILLAPLFTACRDENKVYTVGVLNGLDFFSASVDGFKDAMVGLGYIEGKNIIYKIQTSEINEEKYTQIIDKFVEERVDLIFVFPTEATMIAKKRALSSGIPVLFVNANIEDTEIIKSVREPGGNITGVRYPGPDLAVKTMEMTKEILPNTKKIAIFDNFNYPIAKSQLRLLREYAPKLGVELVEIPADDLADLKNKIAEIDAKQEQKFDVIMLIAGVFATNPETFYAIAEYADKHGIPVAGAAIPIKEYQTLFDITTDIYKTGTLVAPFATKILNGMQAGTIPVVSSEPFVTINTIEAKRLGIEIPVGILSIADKIIK